MTNEIVIAPSILAADFAALGAEVRAVDKAGADWIHLDVMDGHFVPNLTFGPPVVAAMRKHTDRTLDVHLMIEPVDPYIAAFVEAGADIITVHVEACPHLDRTLEHIGSYGVRAGVALNPATAPESIEWVLDRIDLVLVMSVNPGFGGQSFIESAVTKVAKLAAMVPSGVDVEVDGGVGPGNAGVLADAGATALVAGSAVFGDGKYQENISAIRSAARGR